MKKRREEKSFILLAEALLGGKRLRNVSMCPEVRARRTEYAKMRAIEDAAYEECTKPGYTEASRAAYREAGRQASIAFAALRKAVDEARARE